MSGDTTIEPLLELDLLRKYLAIRALQSSRGINLTWIINPAVDGNSQAPLIAAKWAVNQQSVPSQRAVRTLNLASEENAFAELERKLADYRAVCINMQGTLEQSLDRVLRTIDTNPALLTLNPLADGGVRIDSLARLIARRGQKTELLLHIDPACFHKLLSDQPVEQVDAIIGTSLWRGLWDQENPTASLARISVLYRASLQRRGYTYARPIPLLSDGKASHVIFATRSAVAISLISDLACRYRRARSDEETVDIEDLKDRVHRLGADMGSASTSQLVCTLSPQLFGEYTITEYRQAVRSLIDSGTITRKSNDPLDDEEPLTFDGLAQMALFDNQQLSG